MTDDIPEQLKTIDQGVLTDVVRKDQNDPELVIENWTVASLGYEKIIDTTGGLFCFSGESQGTKGFQPWKVVMKWINNPKEPDEDPRVWYYWQREILAFQSGFLEQLPPGVRAPRFYGTTENDDGGVWLWMEHIQETTGKHWSLEDFRRAAHSLGKSQGKYLVGTPLIDHPWLTRAFFRNAWDKQGWWSEFMNPSSTENAWQSPVTQRGFDDKQKLRVLQLLDEKEYFFDANYRLPQVLCHNDASRKNFMWSRSAQTGEEELVGIDWAFSGIGALGNDLGQLVGTSLFFFEYDPMKAETLEAAQLEGYLAGLADNDIQIDPRLVRLAYLISLSFWMGVMLPGWTAVMLAPESKFNVQVMFGYDAETVLEGWVRINEFCLSRADEARVLIQKLGL